VNKLNPVTRNRKTTPNQDRVYGISPNVWTARERRTVPDVAAPLSARGVSGAPGGAVVSGTSNKHPRHIMADIHRALTLQRVVFKMNPSGYSAKCQKNNLKFEVEIQNVDADAHVVKVKRNAGDVTGYRDIATKLIGDINLI